MKLERFSILLLLCTAAALAFVGARWQSWSDEADFPDETAAGPEQRPTATGSETLDVAHPAPRLLLTEQQSLTAPAYFDPDLVGGMIHAEAFEVLDGQSADAAGRLSHAPATMRHPSGAVPIDSRSPRRDSQDLRDLIDLELRDQSHADRDVWMDVLGDLSLKEAAEILKIWKITGGPNRLPDHHGPETPRRANPNAGPATAELLERVAAAQQVVRHNIAHADVAGFRRGDATIGALTASAGEAESGLLDLTPGELVESGNPLHLAIAGTGFFVLRNGDETVCTRCGRFDLSASGRLIQRRADGEWELEPRVQIPEDAVHVTVAANGAVEAHRSGKSSVSCGRVELAAFLNPQHLSRGAADFLRPSDRSGPLHRVPAGGDPAGRIQQGFLEQSNATIEREQRALDRMERQVELFRVAGGDEKPHR